MNEIQQKRIVYPTPEGEFDAYRLALRQIAVTPTEGDLEWPVKPQAVWNV